MDYLFIIPGLGIRIEGRSKVNAKAYAGRRGRKDSGSSYGKRFVFVVIHLIDSEIYSKMAYISRTFIHICYTRNAIPSGNQFSHGGRWSYCDGILSLAKIGILWVWKEYLDHDYCAYNCGARWNWVRGGECSGFYSFFHN